MYTWLGGNVHYRFTGCQTYCWGILYPWIFAMLQRGWCVRLILSNCWIAVDTGWLVMSVLTFHVCVSQRFCRNVNCSIINFMHCKTSHYSYNTTLHYSILYAHNYTVFTLSRMLGFAQLARSSSTTSRSPLRLATCSAVAPSTCRVQCKMALVQPSKPLDKWADCIAVVMHNTNFEPVPNFFEQCREYMASCFCLCHVCTSNSTVVEC